MKVIAINGSPRKGGNTSSALEVMQRVFSKEGVEFEMIDLGVKPIRGCIACRKCSENQNEQCIFSDDIVNESVQKMKNADAIILGSPVYFAGIAGGMKSFLDRVFYVSGANGNLFKGKVGASVVAVRRSGGSATFSALNYYLGITQMLMASSNYWHIIHGRDKGEAQFDAEGVQAMEVLAGNMLHLMRMSASYSGQQNQSPQKEWTHFVREDLMK